METVQSKAYYAIIPANVRYDSRLPANAKLLYGEITALCNEKGYCWASNEYFAELYKVSKASVSSWISKLAAIKYITIQIIYKEGTKEILHRYIKLFEYPIQEILNTPIQENLKDNITLSNNTINNTLDNIYVDESKNDENKKEDQFIDKDLLFADEQLESKNPVKDKKKEKHTAAPIFKQILNTYLSNYDILYSRGAVSTEKPIMKWAKECKNLKDAIKSFGADVVLKAMEQSINNEYCIEKGYSFSLIINPTVMNSILNGKSKASPTVAARRTEICEIPEA